MTDNPAPQAPPAPVPPPPAPTGSSVVIDANSSVHVSKWPMWTALGVVAALIAFTVVWFVANKEEKYSPGPWSLALLDSFERDDITLNLAGREMKCIDSTGARLDVDPKLLDASGVDVLGGDAPETTEFSGEILDVCFTRATRVELVAQSMLADAEGAITEEQAKCVGGAIDDAIVDNGGYRTMMDDEGGNTTVMMSLFGALDSCGVDIADLMSMGA